MEKSTRTLHRAYELPIAALMLCAPAEALVHLVSPTPTLPSPQPSQRAWRRHPAQCHLILPKSELCKNCGPDPLVRGRRPCRPVAAVKGLIPRAKSGSGRPTIYAESSQVREVGSIVHPACRADTHVGAGGRSSPPRSARVRSTAPPFVAELSAMAQFIPLLSRRFDEEN